MKASKAALPDLNSFAQAPKIADEALRSALQLVSDEHKEQEESLKLEQRRLTAKYGQDSQQAKNAALRLESHEQMRVGIRVRLERLKVQSPKASPNNFILYGRVLQEDGEGANGLAVAAIDQKSQPVAKSVTDESGAFQLPITAAEPQKPGAKEVIAEEAASSPAEFQTPLRLQVSDARKKVLFQDQEPFQPVQGRISYREIVLSQQAVAITVKPGKKESRARSRTESRRSRG